MAKTGYTRIVKVHDSSNIDEVAYDPTEKQMRVSFISGGSYIYPNVVKVDFGDLISAPSVGKFFDQNFRSRECTRIGV